MTIRSILIALPLTIFGWFSTLLVVALVTDDAPAYVVLFPSTAFLHALPDEVSVISASAASMTLVSETRGFAHFLYGQGAWIVLPAGLRGCLPLPEVIGRPRRSDSMYHPKN